MHIKSKNSWLKHFDFILWDIVILLVSFVLANLIYLGKLNFYPSNLYAMVFLCILIPCILIDILNNPYSGVLRRNTIGEITKAFETTTYNIVFSVLLMYILKLGSLFSRGVFILTFVIYLVLIIIIRIIWKRLILEGKVKIFPNSNNSLLIVCNSKDAERVVNNINVEEFKQHDIAGLCITDEDKTNKKIGGYKVLCSKRDIYNCVTEKNIGEIFIYGKPSIVSQRTVEKLLESGIGIHLDINTIFGVEADEQLIDKVGIYKTLGLGLYTFTPKQSIYLVIKRVFDLIISLIAIVPILLFILLVKIAFVLTGDKESIFFKQKRIGQHGVPFDLYKFRTMVPNAEEELEKLLKNKKLKREWDKYHKLENDPRTTKVGNFLRKTSLDEVPQFINVLKGDMSIVGPRPLVEGELKKHNGLRLYEKVKPGITGWWACNGRSNISYEERLELEYYYIKNCSLSLDILTLIRTVYVVLKRTGAE